MALLDTLNAVTHTTTKCRIERLFNTIGEEDVQTLRQALNNRNIRHADLTKALRKEYGHDAVADKSVASWRTKNLTELTGL